MKRYYKDFYGCTASIAELPENAARLIVRNGNGRKILDKEYTSFKGARIAMSKMSECWHEVKK